MSDLVLNREHVRQMLLREDFYVACPEFAKLRDCAEQTFRHAQKQCGDCARDGLVFRALFDAFFYLFRDANADTLRRLRDYLAAKKGYRPARLIMYYRMPSGTSARLSRG